MNQKKQNILLNTMKITCMVIFINVFGLFAQQYLSTSNQITEDSYSHSTSPSDWLKAKLNPMVLVEFFAK